MKQQLLQPNVIHWDMVNSRIDSFNSKFDFKLAITVDDLTDDKKKLILTIRRRYRLIFREEICLSYIIEVPFLIENAEDADSSLTVLNIVFSISNREATKEYGKRIANTQLSGTTLPDFHASRQELQSVLASIVPKS
jgi:hypothetical protein